MLGSRRADELAAAIQGRLRRPRSAGGRDQTAAEERVRPGDRPRAQRGRQDRRGGQAVLAQGLPVLVVDDGSSDGTGAEAAAAGARVLRLEPNRGKGAALKAGFRRRLTATPVSGAAAPTPRGARRRVGGVPDPRRRRPARPGRDPAVAGGLGADRRRSGGRHARLQRHAAHPLVHQQRQPAALLPGSRTAHPRQPVRLPAAQPPHSRGRACQRGAGLRLRGGGDSHLRRPGIRARLGADQDHLRHREERHQALDALLQLRAGHPPRAHAA